MLLHLLLGHIYELLLWSSPVIFLYTMKAVKHMRATQFAHLILNCWVTLANEVFDLERLSRRDDGIYGAQLSGMCWDGCLEAQLICR